ncbi:putative duf890 domain protein [Neofusicoccum parvum UCRNP2]|uniref:Uncharacterized protein n=2 Tax=Neofusicoccum parvum TaxID=310453 RepID=A0ACB5S162_9PEZI|nr:putative duf890 domain protein [Neofusicoccum parvum UCRNP2]GME26457.1 hypothetical protein BKCO1_2300076 [Neofusicoccum parvum]
MLHGEEDPDLTEIRCSTKDRVDFHDPRAVRQLTASLLNRDFGLAVDLPPDRLCPPTSRYLYVRWIQDLVESINPSYYDSFEVEGTSLLPNPNHERQVARPKWRMNATDIDQLNFSHALRNVQANGFSPRCHVMKTKPTDPLIPLAALELDHLDFTICNPPFFASVEEWKASISGEGKAKGPNSVCTGAEVEMVTEGGDLGFVLRMVEESLDLGKKVAWYTSMLGKLSSTIKLVERLKEVGCKNWAVCCLGAQHKTRRWAVGWSWRDLRPSAKEPELKEESENDIALGFEISVQTDELVIRWVQGQDKVLFESFCGMMKQTLQPMLAKREKERNTKADQ